MRRLGAARDRILPRVIDRERAGAYAKYALDRYAAARVAALAATYGPRRALVGEERAYLELSERAARWTGVVGERMRAALHRALGTPIGDHAVLRFGCILERPPLRVGRMTAIGHYVNIQHASVGADCLISDHVLVLDGRRQHSIERIDVPINAQEVTITQVQIGDDCLIGGRAVIMEDIGDHCVVAAGSVVIHPVEPYEIVAGNPARVIGDRRERALRSGPGDPRPAQA
jgi:acetyltransferase-like isoleucine patch superfamily enzyme